MRCSDVMSKDLSCVAPEASAAEVAGVMRDEGVGLVPVCGPDRHALGVVTDRDVALAICTEDVRPSAVPVGDFMNRELKTVGPEDTVEVASEMMAMYRTSRVLVVDREGGLLGIVSLADLAVVQSGGPTGEILRRISARPKPPGVPTS